MTLITVNKGTSLSVFLSSPHAEFSATMPFLCMSLSFPVSFSLSPSQTLSLSLSLSHAHPPTLSLAHRSFSSQPARFRQR